VNLLLRRLCFVLCAALLPLAFLATAARAQQELKLDQPHRLRFGASVGTGGVHVFCKPSLDLHHRGTSLRLAPGLLFLSMQFQHQLLSLQPNNRRQPLPLFMSFGYHRDWLLGKNLWLTKSPELPKRSQLHLHTVMFGLHFRNDLLDRTYWEIAAGPMLIRERYHPLGDRLIEDRFRVVPMIEIRLGGVLQLHKHYHRRWPW